MKFFITLTLFLYVAASSSFVTEEVEDVIDEFVGEDQHRGLKGLSESLRMSFYDMQRSGGKKSGGGSEVGGKGGGYGDGSGKGNGSGVGKKGGSGADSPAASPVMEDTGCGSPTCGTPTCDGTPTCGTPTCGGGTTGCGQEVSPALSPVVGGEAPTMQSPTMGTGDGGKGGVKGGGKGGGMGGGSNGDGGMSGGKGGSKGGRIGGKKGRGEGKGYFGMGGGKGGGFVPAPTPGKMPSPGGGGQCGCDVEEVNLDFVLLPYNLTVPIAPSVSLSSVGSVFTFYSPLFNIDLTEELPGTFVGGLCHRTQPVRAGELISGSEGGGYCFFTFTVSSEEGIATFNAVGELFDLRGGTLAITGGTGSLTGVYGQIEFSPIYETNDLLDIFTEVSAYIGNANLTVPLF